MNRATHRHESAESGVLQARVRHAHSDYYGRFVIDTYRPAIAAVRDRPEATS